MTFGLIKSGLSPLKDNIKLTNHASILMDFISIPILFRINPIWVAKRINTYFFIQ
jgi:hypothetical protein